MPRDDGSEQGKRATRRILRPQPTIIDTGPMRAIKPTDYLRPYYREVDATPPPVPPEPKHSRREFLLRCGGALAAGAVGIGLLSQTKPAKQAFAAAYSVIAPPPPPNPRIPFGYFHGFFSVDTPEEVAQAAALGVVYVINYHITTLHATDPDHYLGKALLRYNMKSFLNIESDYLGCHNGYAAFDAEGIKNLVLRFRSSPLLAGYWIKDDDCGDMGDAVIAIRNLVRSLDPDPTHLIMPGFGDAYSVARNYRHGMADLLGFYPYPAYSRGPAREVPEMLRIVAQRTPSGATPPPFVGIYQDFANPPQRPVLPLTNIIDQVSTYMNQGAVGLVGFGWEASIESVSPSTNGAMQQNVGEITKWLTSNGFGAPPRR